MLEWWLVKHIFPFWRINQCAYGSGTILQKKSFEPFCANLVMKIIMKYQQMSNQPISAIYWVGTNNIILKIKREGLILRWRT